MSRRFIIGVFIFVFLFLAVSKTYACPGLPPTAVISGPYTKYACVGCNFTFEGDESHDNDDLPTTQCCIVNYSWSGGGTPPSQSGSNSSFTTKWDTPTEGDPHTINLTVTDNEGMTHSTSCKVYVIKVDKIQYDDPDTGYTDIQFPIYVYKGTTVTFKAIPDPSDASWPSGKPVWGGSSGASGTGSTTQVTFDTLSSSTTDYKTVTATCGNTVTANVIVYKWLNVTTPQDNFLGGSPSRYGVYEKVDLTCEIEPPGLTGTQVGGLRWSIQSGLGTLADVTDNGTAIYQAHTSAGSVTLRLKVQSGPSKGEYIDSSRTIVEPDDGGVCIKRSGTNIWHELNTFSIGLNTNMYLRPTDVSFKWTEFTEAWCNSQTSGWFNIEFTNKSHTAWGFWEDVSGGNSTTGCRILQPNGDFAVLGDVTPYLPYFYGTFLWDIPWWYKAGSYTKTFTDMNQEFRVYGDGKAEVRKDNSGWFYNYHGWPSQPY